MSNLTAVQLTTLLSSSPYLLGYAIPLLIFSLVLTFAGAYLTLDRTRQFPARADAGETIPGSYTPVNTKRFRWILEGGIGGIVGGFLFGLHLSTFIALLIPNNSSSAPLSTQSFLAVWIISSIFTTVLAARWKYAALLFIGTSGGASIGLALSIILHPALLSRVILTAITTPVLAILPLLPLPRFQHAFLRCAASSTGAFGLVVSISLLANIPSWAGAWSRLWTLTSSEWDSAQEKGLDAAYCVFLCAGIACDWFLRHKFGENPDEKWDSYLANYAANLPTAAGAGTYQPLTSIWDRIFGTSHSSPLPDAIIFPSDGELVPHYRKNGAREQEHEMFDRPAFLRKEKSRKKSRSVVKFRPVGGFSSDSDNGDEDNVKLLQSPTNVTAADVAVKPWMRRNSTALSNNTTLADVDEERQRLNAKKAGLLGKGDGDGAAPEYSDHESDGEPLGMRRVSRGLPGWKPEFLERERRRSGQSASGSQSGKDKAGSKGPSSPPLSPGAVPVTPSLINALDRIALAQKTAFSPGSNFDAGASPASPTVPHPGAPYPAQQEGKSSGDRWDAFWKEVKEKAGGDR